MDETIQVEVGQVFTYLGIKYKIIEVTETEIGYRRENAGKFDQTVYMRIGSSKFVKLFGGKIVEIVGSSTKVVKPVKPAIIDEDDEEDIFGPGPIVEFIDAITFADTLKDKTKVLKEGLFDLENEDQMGKLFAINCAIEARQLVFAEPEEIVKHMLEFDGVREDTFTEELFELVETFLGKETLTKKQWNSLIELIPVKEQTIIAYCLGGWGIEKLGIKKRELQDLYFKCWEEMGTVEDEEDEEDELKI